jgi:D-glycero-alpha-D-manno-heptose-7-phosphate kinase
MILDKLIISKDCLIKEALSKMESNNFEMLFVEDLKKNIIGVISDGDIMRKIISGVSLETKIQQNINKNFIWLTENYNKEEAIKLFDSKIRYIPVLNKNKNLVDILYRDKLLYNKEDSVYIRSVSPVRISFGGGGSDLTHYFVNSRGAVMNTTISLFCHATLEFRKDYKISIESQDLKDKIVFQNIEELTHSKNKKFGLIISTIKLVNPTFGFNLYINSDFDIGSGLGGSSSVCSAVLGCFNEIRKDKWTKYELSEIAYQAERFVLGISGGWQDQYATVFGGINFIEFSKEKNIIHPLNIDNNILIEFEESLILCNTGINHDSGNIHDSQRVTMEKQITKEKVKLNVDLTYEMKDNLLRGDLYTLGTNLNQAWQLKKEFNNLISNSEIDNIYDYAISNGAIGGKLLGAGGGGYFLFYVTPFKKIKLLDALKKIGLKTQTVKFTKKGLQTWTVRYNFNKI